MLHTHSHRSWGSSSYPHSQGAAGASEVDLWSRVEVSHGLSPDHNPPLLPLILPTSFFSSGSSVFSSGRSGQSLFLVGVGLGCFWRRMYSTKGEADSEHPCWVGFQVEPSVPRPESSPCSGGAPTYSPHNLPALSGHCSPVWASQSPPLALRER